ncbi:MAG: hypothetical protein HKN50_08435 [Gammaproteobacteria bacterium]|nr:hypothetical protein [Gammaproteobacteria bacterium]
MFYLRLSVALVLLIWTIDKFVNPAHATRVYEAFYFLPGVAGNLMTAIGVAELILVALFLIGRFKNITYLLVLLIHAVSTLTPFAYYLSPWEMDGLLFFAAWPMLAACWMLYVFRAQDSKYNF